MQRRNSLQKYNRICVRLIGGKLKFPKSIPQPRSDTKNVISTIIASVIFFIASFWASTETNLPILQTILVNFGIVPSIFILAAIFKRFCQFFDELTHFTSRYDNNFEKMLQNIFQFNFNFIFASIFSIFSFTINFIIHPNVYPWDLFIKFGPQPIFLSTLSIYILFDIFKLDSNDLLESLWISSRTGLDYGSGMAQSYFHGYLKLILPNVGTEEKYLEEIMTTYEASNNVTIPVYKLFILIPKSAYCPTELKSESIESCSCMEGKIRTVAGVKDRVYKNTVYEINFANKRVYVVAEYATPLKTFRDVFLSTSAYSDFYKKHKNEIVLQFYLTLRRILNENVECTNYCELIYYDDMDENGRFYDVGKILMQRVNEIIGLV